MNTCERMDISAVTDYIQAGAGVAGVLNAGKIIFGINVTPPQFTKQMVVGAITQSPDAGLAPATVTWGAAGRDAGGDIVTMTATVPVKLTTNANATTITCWGLTDSTGANLLLYEILATPINLPDNVTLYNVQIPFAPGNPSKKVLQVTS